MVSQISSRLGFITFLREWIFKKILGDCTPSTWDHNVKRMLCNCNKRKVDVLSPSIVDEVIANEDLSFLIASVSIRL